MSKNLSIYDLKRSLPNKLLNADGSITDFQGNLISPANESLAKVYENSRSIANKFVDADGSVKTYAQISLELFVPVETLPETGEKNKIYLVPSDDGMFDEYYFNENNKWDKIGEVKIDLSNYPTIEQMNTAIENAVSNKLKGDY